VLNAYRMYLDLRNYDLAETHVAGVLVRNERRKRKHNSRTGLAKCVLRSQWSV
jgi:hypothetical protein